ncbi:putative transaldolase [Candidatus Dependentiae bacterium Noda2021]|nr:putative transaldolase [Candidatus Dependentiae bacterium Noda2021]
MKIFLDTAHIESIEYYASLGIIDGITTNPTNLSKATGNPTQTIQKICALLPDCPVNVEVTHEEPQAVYSQALAIHKMASNIVVKIPCHEKYYPVIKQLVQEGVSINITLVFSLLQSLMMCKLGVDFISPFVGRLDDIDSDGIGLLNEIRLMIDMYEYKTKILAASIRSIDDLHEALLAGADIATLPMNVLEKAIKHPLTDEGIKQFLNDWDKTGYDSFPE